MTAKSSLSSFGRLKKSGRWLALSKVIALPSLLALAGSTSVHGQPLTPVQQATQSAPTALGHNVQTSNSTVASTVSAPSVPSSSSIITAAVAANLAGVVNPTQTVIDIGSFQNGVYAITGNFVNTSNLILISTNPNIHTATINSSGSIFNALGASISTLIPTGYSNAISNLNLVLIANTGIYNAGNITSAGSLSMTAPVVANVMSTGANAVSPVMSALNGNLNITSNVLLNQGVMSSALANINVAAMTSNLAINAIGGTFSAPNGVMNVGTQNLADILNIQILGGDYLTKALSVNAGKAGLASISVNSLSGTLNVTAENAYILCNTGTLLLGDILVGGDPETTNNDGDIIFTGVTDVANIQLTTPGSVLSQGATSILSQTGIYIDAGKGIDLTGVTSIGTNSGEIRLISETGSIVIPGVHISSNGGDINLIANQNLTLAGGSAVLDSSKAGGPGGHIFLVSQFGSVDLGSSSIITTGASGQVPPAGQAGQPSVSVGAYNGINMGSISTPGAEIVMASGVLTTGVPTGSYTIHIFDGPQALGHGSGGITTGVLSTALDGLGAGTSSYIHASNGDLNMTSFQGNGGNITAFANRDINVQQGINNASNGTVGGMVTVAANRNLSVGTGIMNDAVVGAGGIVSASAGQLAGLNVANGVGGALYISNSAATDGGSVSVSNTGPLNYFEGGINAKAQAGNGTQISLSTVGNPGDPSTLTVTGKLDSSNATANGTGGLVTLSSASDINLQNATISANGSGTGQGSLSLALNAVGNINCSGATITATGGSNGDGGAIQINSASYTGGSSFILNANGNGTGQGGSVSISLSNSGAFNNGDLSITAQGSNGGSVFLNSNADLTVSNAVFNVNPNTSGNGGSVTLSSTNGNLTVLGDIHADGLGTGNGGSINLTSGGGSYNVGGGGPQLFARGGATSGSGGQIRVSAGNNINVAQDAVMNVAVQGSSGAGGVIALSAGNAGNGGGVTVNGALDASAVGSGRGGTISIQAASGSAAGSGYVNLNSNLNVNGGASAGSGGTVNINLLGDTSTTAGVLNVNANITADGGQGARGGRITLNAAGDFQTIKVGSSSVPVTLEAKGNGVAGRGGQITFQTFGQNGDIQISNSNLIASSTGGSSTDKGGQVSLSTFNGNINLSGSNIDASSNSGGGGTVSVNAGQFGGTGAISLDGSINADAGGTANGGSITLNQSSVSAMQIGALQSGGAAGTGVISANGLGGAGGSLTLNNTPGSDLNVSINESISLRGSNVDNMGTLSASSTANVNLSGAGTVVASLNGSGISYSANFSGNGTTLGVAQLSSTAGNVTVKATANNGALVFGNNANLSATGGAVEIGAPSIQFRGSSSISMDNAGVLKVNSGNQTNSLNLDFAPGSVVTFNVSQGASLRPGSIAIGPNGNGGLNLTGSGSVNFNGGTVSLSSSNAAINLGAGLSLSSDTLDTTQNVGMELIATNGDINLNSTISARQLNVSTISSGNINQGSQINSPTVVLSVQGNSSINQIGSGSIGIGTLILSAQTGNIGSAANPIEANVLEVQVNGGGSAYINNASSVDVKTSTVAGTFQLTNDGDVALESNITAGNLNITANNGSISIFNAVSGSSGVNLAASGAGTDIDVAAGVQVSSTAGNIIFSTDKFVLDGSVLASGAGAQVSINSSNDLNLSGLSGTITANGGGNSLINLSGSNSVTFASSYTLNAGPSGTAQVQTSNNGATGVVLAANSKLTAAGGSQLNIFSNALSFGTGSSMSLSNAKVGVSVQSIAGSALTIGVAGLSNVSISSAGGAVQFIAGLGGALNFSNQGAGVGSISVSGGNLVTVSTSADTSLNNVNLNSNGNISVAVNGGNLNLNGNLTSSQANGVIVLQDPNGITINGNGVVGFTAGLSGSVFVEALSAGANLQFNGNTQFNAGASGTVTFSSLNAVVFGAGATPTINGGSNITVNAPQIVFGSQSHLNATGASSITLNGSTAAGLDIVVPASGSATVSTNGGSQILITASSGAPIVFDQAAAGSGSTLNLSGASATVSTSNANVTINSGVVLHSDNNVNVLTPGGSLVNNGQIQTPGSTTTIQAAGNLVIDKNVSALSLIIQTTANNGNITLSADVNVVGSLLVSANGSGNIIQTKGLLTADSITLMSQSGKIGSENGRIQVKANELNVSTTNSAYVQSKGAICVESFDAGKGFNLKSDGTISVMGDGSKVTINTNAIFNAGVHGTVQITAANLVQLAANTSVRVEDSALSISAANITMGNGSKFSSASNLTVNGDVSGGNYKLVSREGNLTLNGSLTGNNVVLRTRDDGNISLNGNLTANSLRIDADGKGNITQSSGRISAANLELRSDSGNIGSASKALMVGGGHLEASTWGKGIVNISSDGNLVLEDSSSGGSFTLNTSGSLTIGDVATRNGSMTLSGTAAMLVEKNANILVNQGNLTIQNTDGRNGSIEIGKNASLIALADRAPLGNVTIAVGDIPSNPVKGTKPGDVSVVQLFGGKAYFGTNGITAAGKNNSINAVGADVIFSTGSRAKSAITLDGNVFILADPPAAASGEAISNFSSVVTSSAAVQAPVANVVFSSPAIANPGNVFSNQVSVNGQGNYKQAIESTANQNELKPIACVSSASNANLHIGGISRNVVERNVVERHSFSSIYSNDSNYESTSSSVSLKRGEMLVNAFRDTELSTSNGKVKIEAGACALVKSNGHGVEVFNLCEKHWGNMKVTVGGKEFAIGAGQKLLIGQDSKVAVRNEKSHQLSNNTVKIAEFPLMSLVQNSDVLAKLIRSEAKEDRQLSARLFKMAACLSVVTSSHGAFHN